MKQRIPISDELRFEFDHAVADGHRVYFSFPSEPLALLFWRKNRQHRRIHQHKNVLGAVTRSAVQILRDLIQYEPVTELTTADPAFWDYVDWDRDRERHACALEAESDERREHALR